MRMLRMVVVIVVLALVAVGLIANPGSPGNYFLVTQLGNGINTVADLRARGVVMMRSPD